MLTVRIDKQVGHLHSGPSLEMMMTSGILGVSRSMRKTSAHTLGLTVWASSPRPLERM